MRLVILSAVALLCACATPGSTPPTTGIPPADPTSGPGEPAPGSARAPGSEGTMASGGTLEGFGGARKARAVMESRSGSPVTGSADFVQKGSGVELTLRVSGASAGEHGVHLHQNGDCSAPDASSAGEHWNPDGHPHGGPEGATHAGDLGNISIGADGNGTLRLTRESWSIGPSHGKHDVLGKSLVFHASKDDLASQPSGNSGARQACGVISRGP